jgi:hypothetical protein
MDWPTRTEEIQALHFKGPCPYAYLWIDYKPSARLLSWCFTFMDRGMCHTLAGKATVEACNDPSGTFLVDGRSHPDEASALAFVFGGHYSHFLEELYRDCSVGGQGWRAS